MCVLVAFMSLGACTTKSANKDAISLDKLVTAYWANNNMEVLVFCEPISEDDPKRGLIGEIGGDKDLHHGTEKSKVVDEFLEIVQEKYKSKVKVNSYSNDKQNYVLNYEDGISIVWDKEGKKTKTEKH